MHLDSDTDQEYWDGCMPDNVALYDIPAFIQHAKENSNVEKISVIAHSLGTYEILTGL